MQSLLTYLLVILALFFLLNAKGKKDKFTPIDHKSKCFSCESQFPHNYAWMGQKTKCFSCVKQALRMCGHPSVAFDELPSPYYNGVAKLGYM